MISDSEVSMPFLRYATLETAKRMLIPNWEERACALDEKNRSVKVIVSSFTFIFYRIIKTLSWMNLLVVQCMYQFFDITTTFENYDASISKILKSLVKSLINHFVRFNYRWNTTNGYSITLVSKAAFARRKIFAARWIHSFFEKPQRARDKNTEAAYVFMISSMFKSVRFIPRSADSRAPRATERKRQKKILWLST